MDDKALKAIGLRLERLEKAVFGGDRTSVRRPKNFTGAAGGTRLLISKGFFKQARTAPAVKAELDKNGYGFRISVVQTGLNRLSSPSCPLSSLKKYIKMSYGESQYHITVSFRRGMKIAYSR